MTRDQFAALRGGGVVYRARDPIHQDTVRDPDRMAVGDVRRRVGLVQADLDQALRRLDAMVTPA